MPAELVVNRIKQRRGQLRLTQQAAARRADVSLATWRRFETDASADSLDGFRADNVAGFARALKLSTAELRALATGVADNEAADSGSAGGGRATATERLFNEVFKGDPLTPVDAMALFQTVAFSDFAPTTDGRFHVDHSMGGFAEYLKGEATLRDVALLCDLPDFVLTQVNNHWLLRMGERIMRIGSQLSEGRVPQPLCLADEYALITVIKNADPPQLGDISDLYPGLRTAEDLLGYDPDWDDSEDEDACREEWLDRMFGGLLQPDESHDFRRHDLILIEAYGQGIYDPTDPRHPLRWFDRDDLREKCESAIAFARLPKEEQDARMAEAISSPPVFSSDRKPNDAA